MNKPLTFVITGANRGIGLELTSQALTRGHRVFAGVRNRPYSLELKDLMERFDGALKTFELDVQNDESVGKFAERVQEALKADGLDALINNAGVYHDGDGKCESARSEIVLDTLNTNAVGPLRMTRAFLPLLRKASSPRIACITSQMGSIADNGSGSSVAYRMSKAALNMFCKTLAIEEKSIVVLALHPGWVQTEMGGPRAPLPTKDSAENLLKLIENAHREQTGKFYSYNGRELPW